MTIAQSFEEFYNNIKTTSIDSTISNRKNQIAKCINRDFRNGLESFGNTLYVGSYGRCTDNIDVSDIDLLVILPKSVYDRYDSYKYNGQSSLLQDVKKSIQTTYSRTDMRADGQVVQVSFNDMTFEVVPCFEYTDGSFCYPDTNNGGTWKGMDPRAEISAVQTRNDETNQNMSALSRMVRSWKDFNNVSIKGITIDYNTPQFLDNSKRKVFIFEK